MMVGYYLTENVYGSINNISDRITDRSSKVCGTGSAVGGTITIPSGASPLSLNPNILNPLYPIRIIPSPVLGDDSSPDLVYDRHHKKHPSDIHQTPTLPSQSTPLTTNCTTELILSNNKRVPDSERNRALLNLSRLINPTTTTTTTTTTTSSFNRGSSTTAQSSSSSSTNLIFGLSDNYNSNNQPSIVVSDYFIKNRIDSRAFTTTSTTTDTNTSPTRNTDRTSTDPKTIITSTTGINNSCKISSSDNFVDATDNCNNNTTTTEPCTSNQKNSSIKRTHRYNSNHRRSIIISKEIIPSALKRLSQSLLPSKLLFLSRNSSEPKASNQSQYLNTPQPIDTTMDFSSLPPSVTNLPLQIQSGDSRPAPKSTRQNRHSFWLGLRQRSSSRLNSTTTLATYPNQQPSRSMTIDSITKSPSLLGPSRVIAVVGNIRRGIGRMILEELVLKRYIVVALIDKPDGNFSRSVEALACSPSLFHAFAIEGGLFGREMIEDRSSPANSFQNFPPINPLQASTQSGTKNQRSNFKLTQMKRSKKFNSMIAISKTVDDSRNHSSTGQSLLGITGDNSRKKIKDELSRIFEAYRVDTVICSFEPQSKSANEAGFRTQERAKDEVQFGLDSVNERKRIESMERAVLESCIQSGVVGRLALTVHSTGPSPSPLTPPPTSSIRPHLMIGNDQSNPRISVTEFRWGFLMNELASEGCLIDGATAENGLGKYLLEPGKGPDGRWVIDFEHKRARLPTCRSISELGKGKQKPETVCFTLAEDVARFVGLACKLREPWDWNTGKMVGDTARGGWDEVVDLIERVSRSKLEREYFQVIPTVSSGGNESSSETSSSKSSTDQQSSTLPVSSEEGTLRESFDKYDDRLRAKLAEEGLDASSVRLSEFVRVWFTPLPQPPTIKIDGSRVRKPQGSAVKHTKKSDQHLAVAQPGEQKEWLKTRVQQKDDTQQLLSASSPARLKSGAIGLPKAHSITGLVPTLLPSSPETKNGSFDNLLRLPAQEQNQLIPNHQHGDLVGSPHSIVSQFNFVPKVIVPFSNNQIAPNPTPESNKKTNPPTNSFMKPQGPISPAMNIENRVQPHFNRKSPVRKGVNSPPTGGTNFMIRRSPLATRVA